MDTHEHVDNQTPCSASVLDTHKYAGRRPADRSPLTHSSRSNRKHARKQDGWAQALDPVPDRTQAACPHSLSFSSPSLVKD
ncbi:hypothetical protein M5K25_022467 [Dendrobium thyrsiflorum]|uniref:Uncharacterized protein n=1 Tax=Dendrobium thyrsiflorum TaxID=117978 RepID=A0ABD0UCE8_DENTH